ncbi:MAG: hypothetical protein U0838_16540 [Chloroflexota bacterium]
MSRVEPRAIVLDVGKGVGVARHHRAEPPRHYRIGQPVKAFVLEVKQRRAAQVMVSRTHKGFLRRLLELEGAGDHGSGTVGQQVAEGGAAGVAPASRRGLDLSGATVGQRGARVQAVVAELAGEKIDVIRGADPSVFVANALSPAQVISVAIDEEHRRIASVTVPERMLSLAIGHRWEHPARRPPHRVADRHPQRRRRWEPPRRRTRRPPRPRGRAWARARRRGCRLRPPRRQLPPRREEPQESVGEVSS